MVSEKLWGISTCVCMSENVHCGLCVCVYKGMDIHRRVNRGIFEKQGT